MSENPQYKSESVPPSKGNPDEAIELSMDQALIEKLESIVRERMSDEQFGVSELADAVAMSRSHLHRRLSGILGISTIHFIRSMRLRRGMDLLSQEVGNVSEVAYRVGFSSNTYFTRCFNTEFGYPPGEIRKRKDDFVRAEKPERSIPAVDQSKDLQPKAVSPLFEAFHPSSSEELVREVFMSMAEEKPTLQKF